MVRRLDFSMTETMATRAVVNYEGPGEPIMLTLYGPQGEAAAVVPLLPKRVLTLAQELLTRGVQAIKADQSGRANHFLIYGDRVLIVVMTCCASRRAGWTREPKFLTCCS